MSTTPAVGPPFRVVRDTDSSQIKVYAVSGTYPAVAGSAETVVGPLAAPGVAMSDLLFVSNTVGVPAGLTITGAYAPAANQITFKVVNASTVAYSGAAAYSLRVLGISP